MGAVFSIPWTWIDGPVSDLNRYGFRTAAMALTDNSVSIDDAALLAEPRLAIVMGNRATDCLPLLSLPPTMWCAYRWHAASTRSMLRSCCRGFLAVEMRLFNRKWLTLQQNKYVVKIMKHLKIGYLQQHNVADVKTNMQRLADGVRDLAKRGAELVVLQELHNFALLLQVEDVDNFDLAEPIPGPSTDFYGALARECNVVIVTSLFERRAPGLITTRLSSWSATDLSPASLAEMHIPDDPAYYEKFYFTPGDLGFRPIQTSVGELGVLVCSGPVVPEAARLMALQGAELLVSPTAIGYAASDTEDEPQRQREAWTTVQRGHAVANGLPVVSVDRVGFEPDPSKQTPGIEFWGSSMVVRSAGRDALSLGSRR